jgi:hypothetical protein
LIAQWPLTAYGKANKGDFGVMESSDKPAIRQATLTALRDAGAFLALRFQTVPEVKAWINSRSTEQGAPPQNAANTGGAS